MLMEKPGPFSRSGVYDHRGRDDCSVSTSVACSVREIVVEENGRRVEGVHLHCRSALVELAKADLEPFKAIVSVRGEVQERAGTALFNCQMQWSSNGFFAMGRSDKLRSSRVHKSLWR